MSYPNGRELDYTYGGDPTDDALSRVGAIEDGVDVLVSYAYLGAGAIMRADYEEPDVRLDLWGGTVGSYDGIDRTIGADLHRLGTRASTSVEGQALVLVAGRGRIPREAGDRSCESISIFKSQSFRWRKLRIQPPCVRHDVK